MIIGSNWQLNSLNLDDFTISVDSDKLLFAKQAKYLGLWVRNDLSWDDRLRKNIPSALLVSTYIRPVYNQR